MFSMENSVTSGFTDGNKINIYIDLNYPIECIQVYRGNQLVRTYSPSPVIRLQNRNVQLLTIVCIFSSGYKHSTVFSPNFRQPEGDTVGRIFKPGDILCASDNYGDFLPPGYMGHSAIVVDQDSIIEAVTSHPQVKKSPIDEFLTIHPIHVHYRSKESDSGNKAANFAEEFLQSYNDKLDNGLAVPPFTFSNQIPLEDLETGLYCSKLVWHSYYQGANIAFNNDFFLFAPEDLATTLQNDSRFKQIYKHPEFGFKIDL